MTEAVAAGGGVALMPRRTSRPHPGITLPQLAGIEAHRHIDVLHRPERAARRAVRTVLGELREAAETIRSRGPGSGSRIFASAPKRP